MGRDAAREYVIMRTMVPSTNWQSDFHQIFGELRSRATLGAIRQMQSLLSQGASPLELAHRTQTLLPKVIEIVQTLSDYGLAAVETANTTTSSTSTSATFPESNVYHLTSEGIQFFRDALKPTTTRTT